MSGFTLEHLEAVVASRAAAPPGASYTRALLDAGAAKCAKKLGEEGVELALAVAAGARSEIVGEAADVLYHLLVALRAREVPLAEVLAELDRRSAQSGLAEKAGRPVAG